MEDELRRLYGKKHPRPRQRSYSGIKTIIGAMILLAIGVLIVYVLWEKQQSNERKTIGNLLLTAMEPVGNTMYVWGGGWSDEDTSSGGEATRIGVSPNWAEFAKQQDAAYNYKLTRYQRQDGLDCSGYLGWCVYNVMEKKSGKAGYVVKSTDMAKTYAKRGFGTYYEIGKVSTWKAGDIMSKEGHVWMVVGSCEDGSVVFLHSTPPGVSLAGTLLADGGESQASKLAEQYMGTYYPQWYARYPECGKAYEYLVDSGAMRWNRRTLSDPEGLTKMSAEEVLTWIFSDHEE